MTTYTEQQVADIFFQTTLTFLLSQYTAITHLTLTQTLKVIRHIKSLYPDIGKFVKMPILSKDWWYHGREGKIFKPFGYVTCKPFNNSELHQLLLELASKLKAEGWTKPDVANSINATSKWTLPASQFETSKFCFVIDQIQNLIYVGVGKGVANREDDYRIITTGYVQALQDAFGGTYDFESSIYPMQLASGKVNLFEFMTTNQPSSVYDYVFNGLSPVISKFGPRFHELTGYSTSANIVSSVNKQFERLSNNMIDKIQHRVLTVAKNLYPVI